MSRSDFDDESDDDDENEDDGYIPCPHCGKMMLEAADYCPSCDRWITSEDLTRKKPSFWVIVVVVILIGMMVLSAIRF